MKYKVTIGQNVFEVEIEDTTVRPIIALVDGERFEVWPEAQTELRSTTTLAEIQALPIDASPLPREVDYDVDVVPSGKTSRSRSGTVLAPIPGTIVSIAVKPGQRVQIGEELCVLDAMKMQSPIRASREGTIGTIHISAGDNVKHHQLLMEYED